MCPLCRTNRFKHNFITLTCLNASKVTSFNMVNIFLALLYFIDTVLYRILFAKCIVIQLMNAHFTLFNINPIQTGLFWPSLD